MAYVLGTFWADIVPEDSIPFRLLAGFITIMAVFEAVGVPMVFMYVPLKTMVYVFSVIFIVMALFVVVLKRKILLRKCSESAGLSSGSANKLNIYEMIYIAAFVALLAIQIYHIVFYDVGEWNSDDGSYITYITAAINDGGLYMTDTVGGNAIYSVYTKYAFCSSYVFFAYCAYVFDIAPAVLERTVMASVFVALAYLAHWLLAQMLFKNRDNRWIFMLFVALVYMFGLISPYSVTFRLLGPNWQGKAILAVTILPFILFLFYVFFGEPLKGKRLVFVLVLSLAAVSYTLGGIVTMAVVPGTLTLIDLVKNRKSRSIVYYLAGVAVPAVIGVLYKFVLV